MSNSPTTSVPEDIDKALDNLIDWMLGHDDEELTNIDFRKAKREVLTTVESYGDRRELEGRIDEHNHITVCEIGDELGAWYEPDEGYQIPLYKRQEQLQSQKENL